MAFHCVSPLVMVGVKVEQAFTGLGLRQLRSPLGGLQNSPNGVEFPFAAGAENARSMAGVSVLPGPQDVGQKTGKQKARYHSRRGGLRDIGGTRFAQRQREDESR
jgi:hypothetical protein